MARLFLGFLSSVWWCSVSGVSIFNSLEKREPEDEFTDLRGSGCKQPGVAVSLSRIYQRTKGRWRWVGFHLNHMLSPYVSADGVGSGRWASGDQRDESDYR